MRKAIGRLLILAGAAQSLWLAGGAPKFGRR